MNIIRNIKNYLRPLTNTNNQDWFWTPRWQEKETDAQKDIEEGRVSKFEHVEDALEYLTEISGSD